MSFYRTNILINRFKKCPLAVKLTIFKSFCMCMYNISLWCNYSVTVLRKLISCYVKCIKLMFCFHKYDSVTSILLQLGLPTFNTIFHNARMRFRSKLNTSCNLLVACARMIIVLVQHLLCLFLSQFLLIFCLLCFCLHNVYVSHCSYFCMDPRGLCLNNK